MTIEELKKLARAKAIIDEKVRCLGLRNRDITDFDKMIEQDVEYLILQGQASEVDHKYREGLQLFLHPIADC